MIAIIAVVALMALGFAIFTISKRMANSSQNDLVNQLDGISNSVFTDLDQQIITGARLKGVVNQVTTADCAILVGTLGLFGNEASLGAEIGAVNSKGAEATLNGNLAMDMKDGLAPMCQLNSYSVKTSLGTVLNSPYVVNYGSILKNSILDTPVEEAIKSTIKLDGSSMKIQKVATAYDQIAEFNQPISFKDGQFTTKLEFATNPTNSRILRYDNTADFTNKGKTMAIVDTATFNSYILKNASGDYMGLVFTQMRK